MMEDNGDKDRRRHDRAPAGQERDHLRAEQRIGSREPQTAEEMIAGMAALRRTPMLADVAEVAAFLASDRAAGMTGTMANVTCGLVLR